MAIFWWETSWIVRYTYCNPSVGDTYATPGLDGSLIKNLWAIKVLSSFVQHCLIYHGHLEIEGKPSTFTEKTEKKLSLDGLRTISFLYYYVAQNASKHVKNDSDSWDLQRESKSQLVDPEFVKWNRETCWTLAAFQPPKRPPCKCQGAANGDTTATQEGLVAKTHVVQLILRLTHHGSSTIVASNMQN